MMNRYEEIVLHFKLDMEQGKLRRGDRMPSIRSSTLAFRCSTNTIIKAYQQLEQEHLIYSVPRSGYFVVDPQKSRKGDRGEEVIDFFSAGPDRAAMPYREFQHAMNQAIERYREDLFGYSETQGMHSLRVQLARQLRDVQVFTVPENVFVATGSQQALHLLITLPFPNGRSKLVVEQPTHPSMLESLRQQGACVEGIEITRDGLNMEHLERLFRTGEIKLFYTVSRFHNPTGYSYTNEEKKRIVALARQYDVYIIEDDYLGDLDHAGKQDPMFAYDPSGRVIYTKSFSKVMLPGLRLGLAVLPPALHESFLRAKFAADVHTPVLMQGALEIYLENGMFGAHLQQMQAIYRSKAERLKDACGRYLPAGTAYTEPRSGFYAFLELPSPLTGVQLSKHMEAKGVLLHEASGMYLPDFRRNTVIRLSISQVPEEQIDRGIRLIAEGIQELQAAGRRSVQFI
ncbi:PLP-dependent aminotransferase family protein [Paenibacillus sacheonensis]|uniref:Aminotransferase class I/II-fold pyridoxal phosphate-dependent enzyme n=1 Tax=Paenibacillus sacheonensis TaxID=742054 RepID=A0A7X5C1G6_9BACL|nr:PLP-dependent aminotransferase family protein [Paenibacillus sacheonensis]MBM7564967.1 DNA-binding transcriptional MocR family regulator [Paenibacillus sacheonensis]NBC70245.1 aminotransferase class I/II-fold pyridoxal phosphate-dependent enzyme [Paenibacillus sacheonensis]